MNVRSILNRFHKKLSFIQKNFPRRSNAGFKSMDSIRTAPFQAPKPTYFELAPCQRPTNINTINIASAEGRVFTR